PYEAPELPRPATGTPKETEASAPPPERRARGPAPREIRMAPAGPPLQGTEQDLSRLRDFMASRGLRATDWAREAGVSSGFLFGFLQGRYRTIPTDYLEKLASAAGVRIEDLVGRRSP
ncbi:MAG: helix-turn-helix transcriptional regulator, partial [Pseudomonadota bacterium]